MARVELGDLPPHMNTPRSRSTRARSSAAHRSHRVRTNWSRPAASPSSTVPVDVWLREARAELAGGPSRIAVRSGVFAASGALLGAPSVDEDWRGLVVVGLPSVGRGRRPVEFHPESYRGSGDRNDGADQPGKEHGAHDPPTEHEKPGAGHGQDRSCHGSCRARASGIAEPAMAPIAAGPPVRNACRICWRGCGRSGPPTSTNTNDGAKAMVAASGPGRQTAGGVADCGNGEHDRARASPDRGRRRSGTGPPVIH